jgi:hypothetical protein
VLLVPLLEFGAAGGGTLADRATGFGRLLLTIAVPAALAAGVGFPVSQFVPETERKRRRS